MHARDPRRAPIINRLDLDRLYRSAMHSMIVVASLALLAAAVTAAAAEGPCDILVAAGNPCVAAHRCATHHLHSILRSSCPVVRLLSD